MVKLSPVLVGVALLGAPALSAPAAAQEHEHHQHHEHQQPAAAEQQHQQHQHASEAASEDTPLAHLEMRRIVSGTAWQPPLTPHAAFHGSAGGWELMGHALMFAGFDWQSGARGDSAPVAVGWLMGMAERRFERGALLGRVMLSPEPATVRDGGYPLLLQTGETWQDLPLHDRQHPHDLFMEVAGMFTQQVTGGLALQLYTALAGEPALGPPGFPHRQSATSDPLAVLGHHWQDSTHITFGVVTAGIVTRFAKLEGSWFNGREPDEDRYDLEFRRPDAFAGRLSLNPTPSLVAQVSYGYLPSPEILSPDDELHRVTASASLHRAVGEGGQWATTAAWGLNDHGHGPATQALLLESDLDLDGSNVLFGRAELLQKSGHDLVLEGDLHERKFTLAALALGYLRNFPTLAGLRPGLGLRAAINLVPADLEGIYGSRTPVGGMVYLRVAVAPMDHGAGHPGSR